MAVDSRAYKKHYNPGRGAGAASLRSLAYKPLAITQR